MMNRRNLGRMAATLAVAVSFGAHAQEKKGVTESELKYQAGASPLASLSSSRGPYAGSATDCVATAPTPGCAHATIEPTLNQCDCTATPRAPV